MIQTLYMRGASFFGDTIWRTRPWDGKPKSAQQTLYDKGYALAALLEEFDSARSFNNEDTRIELLITCLHRCSTLDADFETWYSLPLQEYPGPLYWLAPSTAQNSKDDDDNLFPAIAFPSFHLAHLHMTYWALRIILSATISGISTLLPSSPTPSIPSPQTLAQHTPSHRSYRASQIMRAVPYSTADALGLLGAQKCTFPLRTAMAAFEAAEAEAEAEEDGGRELARCCAVYEELFTRRKVMFARDLMVDGRGEGRLGV
jgi:hypothetical protein